MSLSFSRTLSCKLTNIYGKKLSGFELALIFLFPLLHLSFYGYIAVPKIISRLGLYSAILVPIIYCGQYLFRRYKFNTIPYYVKLLLLAVVISMFVSLFSRGQGLFESFKANMGSFLGYIYFFVLYKIKPSTQVIIRLIFTYAIIYLLCYIWGMLNAPNVIFGGKEELEDGRAGIFRLRLRGLGFVVLSFFFSIVKSASNKRWHLLSAGLYTLIVLSLTRQYMLFSLMIAGLFFVWKKVWLRVLVGVLTIFLFTLQNVNVQMDDSSVIGSLVNMTIAQIEAQDEGDGDIRVMSFNAQVFDFHQNIVEVLFGGGVADVTTSYGKWEQTNFVDKGYYRSDVGYAGTYVTLGILGLLIFLAMFYQSQTIQISNNIIFAQLFIYFVLLTNIASWPLFTSVSEICICLYLLSIHKIEQRVISLQNN